MRFKLGLILLILIPFNVLSIMQDGYNSTIAHSQKAKEYYNYSNRFFNYIQANGKFSDFQQLLNISKQGLSFTKPHDFKNLSGLQYITGMAYKVLLKNDSAFYYLNKSIENAQRGNEVDIEVSAIQQINYLYRYLGRVEETIKYIKRLNILNDEVKDISLKDKIVSALSDDFLHKGAYKQAIGLLLGSLATKEFLYKQKKDNVSKVSLGLALSELGSLYLQLNQNQNALNFLKKGEPYFSNYTGGRVRLYRKLQQVYLNLSKVDSATIYYKKVYAVMQPGIYESAEDISGVNRVFAEYFIAKQNIAEATKYAKTAYDKGMISGSKEAILLSTNMMGNLCFAQKKYQEAIGYFEKALPSSNNFSRDVFASINLKLAQSYEHLGNYKKANLFYNRYNVLRDSIYLEKTKEDINIIEFKYKSAQKEQYIDFLNVQSKLQEKELVRQKQYKTILIISVFLVLIIAGLIFYNYRNKQKINLLLAKKNQQLDIVNAQLNNANQTKTKLFSIISHDLRRPVSQLFTFLRSQQVNPSFIPEDKRIAHQKKLMTSANNLLSTMEDLLLWSKSQMDNFELDIKQISVLQLFEESLSLMQNQAEEKNVQILVSEVAFDHIKSDQNLLIIILRNLLQNAINNAFENTTVLLNAKLNSEELRYISIENRGMVISQEKIEGLLSNQYVNSKTYGYGMLIVKELLQKLNATLKINSEEKETQIKILFL